MWNISSLPILPGPDTNLALTGLSSIHAGWGIEINGRFEAEFLFQAIQFSQTVLIQTIQFSISMQLVLFNP